MKKDGEIYRKSRKKILHITIGIKTILMTNKKYYNPI